MALGQMPGRGDVQLGGRTSRVIATNIPRFPVLWSATDGSRGTAEYCESAWSFILCWYRHRDVQWLVNCDIRKTLLLAALRIILPRSPQLVALDCVLRAPRNTRERLLVHVKRVLFSRVSLFLNYFRDTTLVCRYYGICGTRAQYIPFKANLFSRRVAEPNPTGEYILCFGWSFRDYDTFFEAVRISGLPAAVTEHGISGTHRHGGVASQAKMRGCTTLTILPDDGSAESQAALIRGARIVVVPILPGSIVASGIGTILNAMALGKCVVATKGVGVSDVFSGELEEVPPLDPVALAAKLHDLWSDLPRRSELASKGHQFAHACGDEAALLTRVVDRCHGLSWASLPQSQSPATP